MSGGDATTAASARFGGVRGPLAVSLVVIAYFSAAFLLLGPSAGALPAQFTLALALQLVAGALESYGVIILVLIVFVAVSEQQRSPRVILASLGFRRSGVARSLLWSVALFPLYALIGLIFLALASPLALGTGGGPVPSWYFYYIVPYSLVPVAVVEEAFARGYLLDRLLPSHPARLRQAVPAILLSSVLFTLYHVPGYLFRYSMSAGVAALLLTANVFPLSVLLGIAYVRSGTRTVAGPVLMHFLFDALPYLLVAL